MLPAERETALGTRKIIVLDTDSLTEPTFFSERNHHRKFYVK